MRLKRFLAMMVAFSMGITCMMMPAFATSDDDALSSDLTLAEDDPNGYGTTTQNDDGSITLNFGENSITVKGNGSMITDSANGNVLRPDNLKTDDTNLAVLTLPSVNLNGSGFDTAEIYAASKNNASVSVKIGDTEIAKFDNVNNGAWDSYSKSTAPITATNLEGNVTLNITGPGAKQYCGNYVYLKLSGTNVPTKDPTATEMPTATPKPTIDPSITATPAPTVDPDAPPYLNTDLSFEERTADLVSRMTLDEKISQIGYKAAEIPRLGVSSYNYWREAIHGVARQGKATSFPSPLSMSNTWNRDLIFQLADITSTEARAKNPNTDLSYYSPTINMARDPRWGRNEETYGEDPYLTGQLGAEFVKGMQGNDEKYLKTIATIKHFAANNNERNRRGGTSIMSEFNFRNYYTKVFQNITEQVMPASVMSSYNGTSIYRNGELLYNYKPSAANPYLLTDLLRRNWGFDGYVTTDCGAGEDIIKNTAYKQGIFGTTDVSSKSSAEAIAQAFLSGMDVECYLGGGCASTTYIGEAVENDYITEDFLDTVIYHLFLQRFRTGEFDKGSKYSDITSAELETQEHIDVAEKTAEESWVLLKNEDNMLPLASTAKNIAIVGNYAGEVVLGDYSGTPTYNVTPYAGLKQELQKTNPDAELSYLGAIPDDAELFNLKSLTLVLKDGTRRKIDLSKAQNVSGMTLENVIFTGVTPKGAAVIKGVDFTDAVTVEAEMSTNSGSLGGSVTFNYDSVNGPNVATITGDSTGGTDNYKTYTGDYTGADGGYGGVADLYLSVSPNTKDFSVENFKSQLDAADVIIAYAGTTTADSKESNDRSSITLPSHQSHVNAITAAYPQKTIVAMQTVGEIDIDPFKSNAKAILWTSYNGQTQGTAFGKIITGQVNPSGRLSTTWYTSKDLNNMEFANTNKQTIGGIEGYYTNYDIQSNGSNPGHTYQYYKGTPIYPFGYGISYTSFEYSNLRQSSESVDANGVMTFDVDVTNTGSVAGQEVVQLYISHPQDGNTNTPKKQLKGFEKVEIQAGETKTVTFTLNVKDMNMFSEVNQNTYVPNGLYTAIVGKNANDTNALTKQFNVTGTLTSSIKTVKAMPDGVVVHGLICEDGTGLTSVTNIDSKLSTVMTDEVTADLSKATVSYTSSNEKVATVDKNGIVSSGTQNGLAVITASVTINGETASTSYPVVNSLEIKPTADDIKAAKDSLTAEYDKLPKAAYSETNKSELAKIYNNAISSFDTLATKAELTKALSMAINDLNSVQMDNLSEKYSIKSENPNYIEKGVIDYRDGGIPNYSGAVGTITENSPYSGIILKAYDESGNEIDSSNLTWQIKKFDNSSRKVADINSTTGELTVYGNGIIQVTAADVNNLTCGTMMIHVNMQIEGEYADEGNGADLNDAQSGSSGGKDAGSTGTAWMEYKSVKLSNLNDIVLRYAGKNAGVVNISLDKSVATDSLIATSSLTATGGWSTWADKQLTLNQDVISAALLSGKLDAYGCATIYIQTNGTNLDYFRMNYIENNDDIPYVIEKALNKTNGVMKATLSYRGSTLATDVKMISAVYNADGTVKNLSTADVKGSGEYEIQTGAADGDNVSLYIWDSISGMKPLSEKFEKTYSNPADSEIVVYSLDSKDYDYKVLSGNDDGIQYANTVNGLSGYGNWTIKGKSSSYTYTDVNEKTYNYTFTNTWQAGTGAENKRSLFFTPKSKGKVTVYFNGAVGRDMYISQNGTKLATGIGSGSDVAFSAEITDTSSPIYVYGGNSNKNLYAIIVEYYGNSSATSGETEDTTNTTGSDIPVQYTTWNNSDVMLTKNDVTHESKVWKLLAGGLKIQLSTEYFYDADVAYNYNDSYGINALAEYKGRLYAGCDNGLVIVFTDCIKCYKLKKAADFDIKEMSIIDGYMNISDGTNSKSIDMSVLGGDTIEADEANLLASNGAVLVDVRTAEEFAVKSVDGSVNIPVDQIQEGLSTYAKDTVLIFYCSAGSRAEKALETAKSMGFTNVYNLGSIDKLL